MANSKISALTSATTPLAGTETLPVVQSSATTKVAVSDLTAGRSVSGANFVVTSSTIPANGLYLPAANSVGIATNSTLRATFDASGNVGIGITPASPAKLEIKQSAATQQGAWVYASANDSHARLFCDGTSVGLAASFTSTGSYLPMKFYTSGTERMSISAAGIVTMSAYGAGAATFSAAGVISSVSDENWKIKDGVPSNPTEMLNKLEPGYWYYNDEKKEVFGVDRQLGFYAQNVNAAIGPEAAPEPESFTVTDDEGVETTQQKPWGYYDRSVLAVVVMSLQEALKLIETLNAKVLALESSK